MPKAKPKTKNRFCNHYWKMALDVTPFGICCLPVVFCYIMPQALASIDFCFTYLDEILIYSTVRKEHLQHLETVFNHLQAVNLKIKLRKCQYFKQHLQYLGHWITEKGIQPLLDKIITIKNLVPKNIDKLHHFLGLTGYYRKFVPLFADVTNPLSKTALEGHKIQWSSLCQAAFKCLKKCTLIETHPTVCKHKEAIHSVLWCQ